MRRAPLEAISVVVASIRVLAITRLGEADEITPTLRDHKKVDKRREEATEYFDEGETLRDAGECEDAIDAYEDAWKKSNDAFKAAHLD